MIRCIEPEGLEAWGLAAWMVILQPGGLGGLAAWMLMALMMRVGMRMLMNDDNDEDRKDVSHARA